jgi:hypothetical protein
MQKDSLALQIARETGNVDILDAYISISFYNDEEYYWRAISTKGNLQNEDRYDKIILLA